MICTHLRTCEMKNCLCQNWSWSNWCHRSWSNWKHLSCYRWNCLNQNHPSRYHWRWLSWNHPNYSQSYYHWMSSRPSCWNRHLNCWNQIPRLRANQRTNEDRGALALGFQTEAQGSCGLPSEGVSIIMDGLEACCEIGIRRDVTRWFVR